MFKKENHVDPAPDFRRYIENIVDNSECARHSANEGTPCWVMPLDTTKDAGRSLNWAVCNNRVRRTFVPSTN